VSPVKYELGFYIPEDGILHSHRREILNLINIQLFMLFVRGFVVAVVMLCPLSQDHCKE
jgi:hypothetical protein